MLIIFFELSLMLELEGEITGSILEGNERRSKTDNFPITLLFDL
jgi:hypothetical protein